jgi:hypothetical protein
VKSLSSQAGCDAVVWERVQLHADMVARGVVAIWEVRVRSTRARGLRLGTLELISCRSLRLYIKLQS